MKLRRSITAPPNVLSAQEPESQRARFGPLNPAGGRAGEMTRKKDGFRVGVLFEKPLSRSDGLRWILIREKRHVRSHHLDRVVEAVA